MLTRSHTRLRSTNTNEFLHGESKCSNVFSLSAQRRWIINASKFEWESFFIYPCFHSTVPSIQQPEHMRRYNNCVNSERSVSFDECCTSRCDTLHCCHSAVTGLKEGTFFSSPSLVLQTSPRWLKTHPDKFSDVGQPALCFTKPLQSAHLPGAQQEPFWPTAWQTRWNVSHIHEKYFTCVIREGDQRSHKSGAYKSGQSDSSHSQRLLLAASRFSYN